MERKIYGIFMAGGQGVRMGGPTPKQFIEIDGKPVLQISIEKFLEACPDMTVVVVLPHSHIQTWKDLCIRNSFDCPQVITEGGMTRFHSVQNGLRVVPDGALVMIHDGVRPLVSVGLLREMAARGMDCPALIPVLPVTDTLKLLDKAADGTLSTADGEDPQRVRIYGAQTPQVFHSEQIKAAYTLGYDQTFTDDASVARKKGIPLSYILGERYNIKLTTPDDLKVARLLLASPSDGLPTA